MPLIVSARKFLQGRGCAGLAAAVAVSKKSLKPAGFGRRGACRRSLPLDLAWTAKPARDSTAQQGTDRNLPPDAAAITIATYFSGGYMKQKIELLWNRLRLLIDDTEGQDLIEYALLAGFVAVAAGALLPGISTSVSTIFSRMGSVLSAAAS
jgi:pilus assembly protein Flp/PilA